MPRQLREIRILGVHPVPAVGEAEDADGLFLIEIEVEPADAEVDWCRVTQSMPELDRSSWQVPYDEILVDAENGLWAFFLHLVQLDQPLMTPVGPRRFPVTTPIPEHLSGIEYERP
jgi:hypothetical protein